jgi:hypothetical protein
MVDWNKRIRYGPIIINPGWTIFTHFVEKMCIFLSDVIFMGWAVELDYCKCLKLKYDTGTYQLQLMH